MKKINLLFVLSNPKVSANFLNSLLELLDYEQYNVEVLSLGEEISFDNDNIKVRDLTNSYLDNGFLKGIGQCIKDRKWNYLPILFSEKITKKIFKNARIKNVKFEGKYRACISVDLESCVYVSKNVLAKIKILRFPFSRVEEPYEEDFEAFKKFSYFVCTDEKVVNGLAMAYEINPEKIKVIPNIINTESFFEKANEYEIERNKKFVFTSLCRLTSLNQIDFIMDVARELIKNDFIDFKWNVISGTEDVISTKIKIRKAGLEDYIDFIKKQENPYPYLKDCDVYIHVAQNDAEFLTLKYANILKKPVLALETKMAKEYIISGNNGEIAKDDVLEFAQKIITLSENFKDYKIDININNVTLMADSYKKLFERPKKKEETDNLENTQEIFQENTEETSEG